MMSLVRERWANGAALMNHMRTQPVARRGFSMVELILVIVILMILAAVAAPSLSRMMKGSRVQQAAKTVVAALYEARAQAQRYRTVVAVFYGDDPSRHGALWAVPLSS